VIDPNDGAMGNLVLAVHYIGQNFARRVTPLYEAAQPETQRLLDPILESYPKAPNFLRGKGKLGLTLGFLQVQLHGWRVRRTLKAVKRVVEKHEPALLNRPGLQLD
jgi:hypothetical protein